MNFYHTIKPVENPKILNYWIIPVRKRTVSLGIVNNYKLFENKQNYITLHPRCNQITVFKKSAETMGVWVKDRIQFLVMEELLYVYKTDGNGCTLHDKKGSLVTTSRTLMKYVGKAFGAAKGIRCTLKPTESEFNGSKLYQIVMPYRYRRSFFEKQRKLS